MASSSSSPSTSTEPSVSFATSTAKPHAHSITKANTSTAEPSIPYEESVGRHVSRSELPPDVQARIERNRQAALERRAKHQRRTDSERAIAQEFGEIHPSQTSTSSSTGSGAGFLTSAIIEKNAAAINKAMEEFEPLPKHEWTKFYDYDLSKMKDTRAGFIQEIKDDDKTRNLEDENSRKRKREPTVAQSDPCMKHRMDILFVCMLVFAI
jgi:DNA-repair protein complementing XP-A cells